MGAVCKVVAGLAATAVAGVGYGLLEAQSFTLRRLDVPVLPQGQRPLRVLHISDLHLLPTHRRTLEFVSRLEALEPDLVIDTGDNISAAASIDPLMAALGRLLDRPGAFVWGSNDYTAPKFRNPAAYLARASRAHPEDAQKALPWEDFGRRLRERGWTDVNHQRAVRVIDGRRFALRGTDDAHLDRDDYSLVAGPDRDTDLSIGVTHAPYRRILDAMTDDGIQLIFAGHTHGGQVCVPGYGALITNCDLPPTQAKGLSTHTSVGPDGVPRTSLLHVSAGLGSSPFAPYRIACPPEATLLTLTPRG